MDGVDPRDSPVPNPPPAPGDPVPVRLPSPRGALRASLLVWGWGQIAAGARRGWLLPPLQVASLVGFWLMLPAASGSGVVVVFLAGVAVLAMWALVAVWAHRTAAGRRAAIDAPSGPTGAGDLLWLAPLVIGLSTALWAGGGRAGDPGLVLGQYLDDWAAGRVDAGIARFDAPPGSAAAVAEAWEGQLAGLRNELVAVGAREGLTELDADHPLESVRWSDAGAVDGGTGRAVAIEVVRREAVRGELFGFLPTTSQRLVVVARLGEVRLRAVPAPGGIGVEWRIERVDAGGIALGG